MEKKPRSCFLFESHTIHRLRLNFNQPSNQQSQTKRDLIHVKYKREKPQIIINHTVMIENIKTSLK